MSTPSEIANSLKLTRQFLYELCKDSYTPRRNELANRADRCLRHFPSDIDIADAEQAWIREQAGQSEM